MLCFEDLPYVWFIDPMIEEANRPGQWRCLSLNDLPPKQGLSNQHRAGLPIIAYEDEGFGVRRSLWHMEVS